MLILRLPEVKRVLGHRADASVYNAIRDGLFTSGVAIGQRAKGWPDYEVQAVAHARVAGKSEDQIKELVRSLHQRRTDLPPAFLRDAIPAVLPVADTPGGGTAQSN